VLSARVKCGMPVAGLTHVTRSAKLETRYALSGLGPMHPAQERLDSVVHNIMTRYDATCWFRPLCGCRPAFYEDLLKKLQVLLPRPTKTECARAKRTRKVASVKTTLRGS
jgi:hypothetical protein